MISAGPRSSQRPTKASSTSTSTTVPAFDDVALAIQAVACSGTCSIVRIQAKGVATAMIIMIEPVVVTVSTAAG